VPAGDLYFLILSSDGVAVEGAWGPAWGGERNGLWPSNTCGDSAKDIAGSCP